LASDKGEWYFTVLTFIFYYHSIKANSFALLVSFRLTVKFVAESKTERGKYYRIAMALGPVEMDASREANENLISIYHQNLKDSLVTPLVVLSAPQMGLQVSWPFAFVSY